MIKFIPVIIDLALILTFSSTASLVSVKLFDVRPNLNTANGVAAYAAVVIIGIGVWLAAAPILTVNLGLNRPSANSTNQVHFGPEIADFETYALRTVEVYNGPGLKYESWSELSQGQRVYVETLVQGFCTINEVEGHWVPCDALAPPPQGWGNSTIRPSMGYVKP